MQNHIWWLLTPGLAHHPLCTAEVWSEEEILFKSLIIPEKLAGLIVQSFRPNAYILQVI